MKIPKIIHQIWLGPNPRPVKWLDTWKNLNPDWEYHLWTEENIPQLENQKQFEEIYFYSGKADILRYEILYTFGGFYADADSEALLSLDDSFLKEPLLVFYENERKRPGLICQCAFGAIPRHPVLRQLIDAISGIKNINEFPPWMTVGPRLFTKIINDYQKEGHAVSIHPSYLFCPDHFEGGSYSGKGTPYAQQHWATTKEMNQWLDFVLISASDEEPLRKNLPIKKRTLSKKGLKELLSLMKQYQIETLLDAPCGDFSFWKDVFLPVDQYIGVDPSAELIVKNRQVYEKKGIHFECLDLVCRELPKVDMILCLDYFSYLTFEEIYSLLYNFAKSGSTYLLATNDIHTQQNQPPQAQKNQCNDKRSFRPMNLLLPPFHLPFPIHTIDEGDHQLALWKLTK